MKKSLIALAVMAASGAAMAQSSVSVYGLVDIWLGSSKSEASAGGVVGSARETVLNSQGFNVSRIGFKGTEDLGGGLKANFTIETAIRPDQPTPTSLGSRVASIGLSGGFGSVELGKSWTPYDDTRAMANDTFNAIISSSFSTWLVYEYNPNNQIRYNTPSFGGFTASASYAFGEDKNIMCYLDDIYSYIKARSTGAMPPGRPTGRQDISDEARESGTACFGEDQTGAGGSKK